MSRLLSFWNLPLLGLLIGYFCFALETVWGGRTDGSTSPLAFALFLAFGAPLLVAESQNIQVQWRNLKKETWIVLLVFLPLLLLILREGLLPVYHVDREYDLLNYGMTLPRQHLIRHELGWLSWSKGDLHPMPLQWAMAPFWFVTSYPNKIPQLVLFFFSLLALGFLGRRMVPDSFWGFVPLIAFLTSHGVLIQAGIAMLDVAMTGCLFLALVQFYRKDFLSSGMYLGLWGSAKAFHPLLLLGLFFVLGLWQLKIQSLFLKKKDFRKFWIGLSLSLVVFLLPFMIRSALVSGTPLFPIGICLYETPSCQGSLGPYLKETARHISLVRQDWGLGRDPISFVKSLWLLSVPRLGSTMSVFDYPLGLPWLVWLVFLPTTLLQAVRNLRKKEPPLELLIAVSLWIAWWVGSQQARWLYPVLGLGWVAVLPLMRRSLHPRVLSLALAGALLFGTISVYRGQRSSWGKSFNQVGKEMTDRLEEFRPKSSEQNWKTLLLLYARSPVRPARFSKESELWVFP